MAFSGEADTGGGHDWTERVPAIAEALHSLRVTFDGEAVV